MKRISGNSTNIPRFCNCGSLVNKSKKAGTAREGEYLPRLPGDMTYFTLIKISIVCQDIAVGMHQRSVSLLFILNVFVQICKLPK